MDQVSNPYSPGAGVRPAALVGRDREVQSWVVTLERMQLGRPAQPTVLHGLRGVGKTVLLGEFQRLANTRGWVTAMVEGAAGQPLRESLASALYPAIAELVKPSAGDRIRRALSTFKSFSVQVDPTGAMTFGLDLGKVSGAAADTGNLELDLNQLVRDLSAAVGEEGHGLVFLIDEAQDLTRAELTALCALSHQAAQQSWPFLVALAGLPSLPRVLSEAKSYAERLFTYSEISQLSSDSAKAALVEPALAGHVAWQPEAVDLVVQQTRGYAYFLQQYGQETWNASDGPDLSLNDAKIGIAVGQALLDAGFFRARWDRATPSQRGYLTAMAVDGTGPSQSREVATRLGKTATALGPTRDGLVKKGLIYAPEHGQVSFTVPGMAEFIARQSQH